MSVIIMLQSEHANLRELMKILEQQLARLENGEPCRYDLLSAIVAYWREYPEQCHHPKEDLLVARLMRQDAPGVDRLRERMVAEHEVLEKLTESLASALESAENGGGGSDLEARLKGFVESNARHLALEEELLFKVAPKMLGAADLEAIEFDLLDRDDPVFDKHAEARYHILLDAIRGMNAALEQESEYERAREHLFYGDTACVDVLTTVEKFNDLVGSGAFAGHVRLKTAAKGGYVIERDGEPAASIPPCTEQQAAWCAYYFLVGAERG